MSEMQEAKHQHYTGSLHRKAQDDRDDIFWSEKASDQSNKETKPG